MSKETLREGWSYVLAEKLFDTIIYKYKEYKDPINYKFEGRLKRAFQTWCHCADLIHAPGLRSMNLHSDFLGYLWREHKLASPTFEALAAYSKIFWEILDLDPDIEAIEQMVLLYKERALLLVHIERTWADKVRTKHKEFLEKGKKKPSNVEVLIMPSEFTLPECLKCSTIP